MPTPKTSADNAVKARAVLVAKAEKRRRAYAALRDAGLDRKAAAAELGLLYDTALRYEKAYQARKGGAS